MQARDIAERDAEIKNLQSALDGYEVQRREDLASARAANVSAQWEAKSLTDVHALEVAARDAEIKHLQRARDDYETWRREDQLQERQVQQAQSTAVNKEQLDAAERKARLDTQARDAEIKHLADMQAREIAARDAE